MSFVGHYSSWPVEVGNVNSGVVYQIHNDGRVYRLEPSGEQGTPGRTHLVGYLERIPETLPEMWAACEQVYWDEITQVPVVWEDLTPVRPVTSEALARTMRGT